MSSREIVTLQIGHYSSFVGTHWWNIQESSFAYDGSKQKVRETDPDVLFREGQTLQGDVTFTPRLICFDLKGSLSSLKRDGTLYDVQQEQDIKWTGDITLHKSTASDKNEFLEDLERTEDEFLDKKHQNEADIADIETKDRIIHNEGVPMEMDQEVFGDKYYNLDDTVKVWSDFLRIHLHPKSVSLIDAYLHGNDEQSFDIYGLGQQVFSNTDFFESNIENKLHFFTEECDHLQGFHVLADSYNGFGGGATHILQYMEDEYPGKAVMSFGLMPSSPPDTDKLQKVYRCINSSLFFNSVSELSSLFVPLSLSSSLWRNIGKPISVPHVTYKSNLDYHTSAILAASLENVSLPYRKDESPAHMRDITHSFNVLGRKCASLSTSFPFPMYENASFIDSLLSLEGKPPWMSLTPYVENKIIPQMQSCVIRGVPDGRVKASTRSSSNYPWVLSQCSSVDEVLQLYLTDSFPGTLNAGCSFRDPCKVVSPFPHIFNNNVSKDGFISETDRPLHQGVESVPVMTSLQSTGELSHLFDSLVDETSKHDLRKFSRILDTGIEMDDFKEVLNNLQSLSECYKDR